MNARTPRRLRRVAVLTVLLGLTVSLVPGPVSADQQSSSETEDYTFRPGGGVDCSTNSGGVCFEVDPGENRVGLFVHDNDDWKNVPMRYEFVDESGSSLSEGLICERGAADIPLGTTLLRVEVGPTTESECGHASLSLSGSVTATFNHAAGGEVAIDGEVPCNPWIGEPLSYALGGDSGETIEGNVLVLLDGIALERGQQVMAYAHESFARRNIQLNFVYQPVTFTATDRDPLFDAMKATVGEEVPAPYDIVHLLTDKNVAGLGWAFCVGGLRYPDKAFSMSEAWHDTVFITRDIPSPVWVWPTAGYVAAHELGHLFGGNHDFANCAEGFEGLTHGETAGGCTVMQPNVTSSLSFSTLNGFQVRGYAKQFLGTE